MSIQDTHLLRRMNAWMTQLFNGKRDLYNVFGYVRNPAFDQKMLKYLRQDVAGRVIDAPAAALWTNPPEIVSTDEAWNTAWLDIIQRTNLWAHMNTADRMAGIGKYSILLIGFNDGGRLDQPVNTRSLKQRSSQKILYIQPYSEATVKIDELFSDPTDDRFMQPKFYSIQPIRDTVSMGWDGKLPTHLNAKFRVHADRVIHIAENTLENAYIGSPRIERVYNVLDDLQKVAGGSAETFWLTANRGLHVNVDKDMDFDTADAKALADEVDEYSHQLRRVIRTRGVEVESLGSDVPDPRGSFEILVALISGATGIPRRILIGSEAGQLASEQDRANWAERVNERRNGWANPSVIHPTLKIFTRAAVLPEITNGTVVVDWPSAFHMSPLEAAQTSAQHARSATNFAKTFETMEKLKRGEPGSPGQTDEEGNTIPGTEKPAIPGVVMDDLITVDEARAMIGLDKAKPTYDSGSDLSGENDNSTKNSPSAPSRKVGSPAALTEKYTLRTEMRI